MKASTNTAINPLQNSGSPPPSSVEEMSKDQSELSDCSTITPPSTRSKEGHQNVRRDPTYWFDDGSVILLVQDVEFRVYRGILERHSSVLREMFSSCSSASQETIDHTDPGVVEMKLLCPVVRLSDSARDWRYLLHWCMRGSSWFTSKCVSPILLRYG